MSLFWKNKRVLVTGATGLIGSWLVEALLQREAYVVALIRDADPQSLLYQSGLIQKISIVQGELEDFRSTERAINEQEIDTVFHLGAQTLVQTALRNPLATFESNIRGTYHLLEACRRHPSLIKRVVIASSDKAYGSCDTLPYRENMPLEGKHPYDVSKTCTDLLAQSYFHTYHLPLVIARFGNVFGGGDLNWSRLIPGTIRSYLQQLRPQIRSDGFSTRDYLYVQDVVRGYLLLGENVEREEITGEAFNFGPNKPYTVLEVVAAIQSLLQAFHLDPEILNQASMEIRHQSLSSEKAKKLLGWTPLFSLEEGLNETLQWYSRFLETSFHVS